MSCRIVRRSSRSRTPVRAIVSSDTLAQLQMLLQIALPQLTEKEGAKAIQRGQGGSRRWRVMDAEGGQLPDQIPHRHMDNAAPKHRLTGRRATIDAGEQRRVIGPGIPPPIVADLFKALQEVGLPIAAPELQRVTHLFHLRPRIGDEEIEAPPFDHAFTAQAGVVDIATRDRLMFWLVEEQVEVLDGDPEPHPQRVLTLSSSTLAVFVLSERVPSDALGEMAFHLLGKVQPNGRPHLHV